MAILNEENKTQLKQFLQGIVRDTTIVLFNEPGSPNGEDTETLLSEMAELSDKLHLEVKSLSGDSELAKEYGVYKAPGYVLLNDKKEFTRVRFLGVPLGHEINSLLSALIEVGGNPEPMPAAMLERVKKIDKPVDIKVFVTLGCPHCPGAVQKAHALALANPLIQAEMVEAQSFPDLSQQYGVGAVPHTVFNGGAESVIGNYPFDEFISKAETA